MVIRSGRFRRLCDTPEGLWQFRECYGVPDDIHLELALGDAMREGSDNLVLRISIMSVVEGGVCFPLHPLLCQTLNTYRLAHLQCTINVFRLVMGIVALNQILGTNLGFWDIHHLYSIICTREEGSYYLKAREKNRKLVTHTPDSAWGDNDDFLVITENWEERDEEGRPFGLHVLHAYGRPRESLSFPPSKFYFSLSCIIFVQCFSHALCFLLRSS